MNAVAKLEAELQKLQERVNDLERQADHDQRGASSALDAVPEEITRPDYPYRYWM